VCVRVCVWMGTAHTLTPTPFEKSNAHIHHEATHPTKQVCRRRGRA
jgi:hypothetical protein